ncbi:MAG: DUF1343 domain-containing protein [Gemmatimonadales bacterium]|nr:DUF1343 domain-containing protein [Gemmatimonadales bacterium]
MVLALSLGAAGAGSAAPPPVRPGLEVLLAERTELVRGVRVGLVANQASVDGAGRHAVDRLREAGVQLVALFSPEHGFRGTAAPGEGVATTTDSATGLPIYSLYGARRAPDTTQLRALDALLIDLPDVGARYYTYVSTALEVLRAASATGTRVIVLDRPNPIGGAVQGNVLDPAARSFVGALAVPMRHGLTLGELVALGRDELGLTAPLTVVPARGWRRERLLDETGLPWIAPSPNLRRLEALLHYPGTCLFEGTNLSVGRGTDAAFEQVGASWLDARAVLARLDRRLAHGVAIDPVSFTPLRPGDAKYADTLLTGLRLRVTDRRRYDPAATAVALLAAIRAVHPGDLRWLPAHFDRLAGGPALRAALDRGDMPATIVAGWRPQQAAFARRAGPYRLY